MALHKDPNGNIHDDMDGAALHLLPAGCVEITQSEADVLRAPTPAEILAASNAAILAQIAPIEAAQVRPTRELLLDSANAFAKTKLAALDSQIATLRAQLQ